MMEFTNETMFLTGRAGTGKSTLLNYFRKNTIKNCVVLAPTGLAALQVGGSTIHSFFGFPLRTIMKNDPDIKVWSKGHPKMRIVRKMDTLIIDEVSMVRVDLMDAIDQSLRLNMDNDIPFGGKQLIFHRRCISVVAGGFAIRLPGTGFRRLQQSVFFSAQIHSAR